MHHTVIFCIILLTIWQATTTVAVKDKPKKDKEITKKQVAKCMAFIRDNLNEFKASLEGEHLNRKKYLSKLGPDEKKQFKKMCPRNPMDNFKFRLIDKITKKPSTTLSPDTQTAKVCPPCPCAPTTTTTTTTKRPTKKKTSAFPWQPIRIKPTTCCKNKKKTTTPLPARPKYFSVKMKPKKKILTALPWAPIRVVPTPCTTCHLNG